MLKVPREIKHSSNLAMAQYITLYGKGLSLRQISNGTGVPRETLRMRLKKEGVELRKSRRDLAIRYHAPSTRINEEVAELLGLHAGDGWLSHDKWGISSNINDEILICRTCYLLRNVVGVKPTITLRPVVHTAQIRSGQRQAIEYFAKYFPFGKKAHRVRLPTEVVDSDDVGTIRGALRGLFSSDGSFSYRKRDLAPRLEFRCKSKELVTQFVKLASKLGFKFNQYDVAHRTGREHVACLTRTNDILDWMDRIGTICDKHVLTFENWIKLRVRG